MPYLTPQELPEDDDCRPLFIPADSEWLALFGGALTELTQRWNWEYSGGLTIDETIDKMTEIIDNWYTVPCASCTLPGGGRIIRIGAGGVLQELGDDGEWQEPTGDYVIPPPEPRTGGTEPDQNCLAARNAVNTLHALYDNLEDSWNDNLDEAEAATAFTLTLIGLVGFEFAPITFGVVAFFGVVFGILYQALEYLGADLWDSAFTDQMVCFLFECASNDGGVVTFDWDCFMGNLNSLTDSFGLSEVQLRLYLQVAYILYFIGGVDGLNLAGGTTAITSGDCDYCSAWCYEWDFTISDGDWYPQVISGLDFAVYSAGNGWSVRTQEDGCSQHSYQYMKYDIAATNISKAEYEFATAIGGFDVIFFDQELSGSIVQRSTMGNGSATVHSTGDITPVTLDRLGVTLNKCGAPSGWYMTKLRVYGEGEMPAFTGGAVCP